MVRQQTQPCHPSHPVRGTVEAVIRNMAFERGEFTDFNDGYVKYSHKRPPVDHDAIKIPLNRFVSYGIAKYQNPVLVTKTIYDEAKALMDFSTQVLGTPQ